jgi:lipopolysaccharide/colanic/teichoic acid biosynthesis glycosyltransferase
MLLIFAIPGILIALAVVLTSKGPVFYREERIGKRGRAFRIWKFRTMCWSASGPILVSGKRTTGDDVFWRTHKHLKDLRITRVGRFLRSWSLDELPQFFNVMTGDMSLIGPRPIVKKEIALYGDLIENYLAVRPGMSGLWQVSGRSNVNYKDRAKLDATYVLSWRLRLDLKILIQTIPAVLNRIGAY